MLNNKSPSRRSFVETMLWSIVPINDHGGRIKPPVAVPDIAVVGAGGLPTRLPQLLTGKASAIQLMFTECGTTCPMQGAIFERVQKSIPDMAGRRLQLVSLSIDPVNDKPEAMRAWLQHFHASSNWIGATPAAKDLDAMQEFFGKGRTVEDNHSTQIHIVDQKAELVWRTSELPSVEEISSLLRQLQEPR